MKKIKLSKRYNDDSGDKISLEINESEKEDYAVKINDNEWMSIKDLEWLKNAIDECFLFLKG